MNFLDKQITVAQAAVICGVPVSWIRRTVGDAVETLTIREALVVGRGYPRDEQEEHRRMKRLALARENGGPGYPGPCPAGVSWERWLAANNVD